MVLNFFDFLLWVILIPDCVRSSTTSIQRHTAAATILYIPIPYFFSEHLSLMGTAQAHYLQSKIIHAGVPDRTTCLRQADDWYASFVLSFYKNQGNFYLLLHFREHHPMHLLSSSSTWISLECTTTWQKTRAVLVEMRFNDAMDICIALQSCFVVLNSKWTTHLGM